MSNFKVGDRVVCVDDSCAADLITTLKVGSQYIINSMTLCKCGHIRLNVGAVTISKRLVGFDCYYCGVLLANEDIIQIHSYTRFRKVIEQPRVIRIEVERTEPVLN